MSSQLRPTDKSKPYLPLASLAHDGWSNDDEASATCFCGTVQLAFPLKKPGLVNTFMCHCSDCHKITASVFATSFTVKNDHIRFIRGEEILKTFIESETTTTGNTMTNRFCPKCGTLMARSSSGLPGVSFLRQGTIDNFSLIDEYMRAEMEIFVKERATWLSPVEGAKQFDQMWT